MAPRVQRRGPGGAPVPSGPPVDPKIQAVADWLRNEKRSGLTTKEAIQLDKRVEFFKGSKLVDALLNPNRYKGKIAKDVPIKTRAEAAKFADSLIKAGFFHRSRRFQHAHSRRWELEIEPGAFQEDALFTWIYEGSKTKLYLMCAGMLVGALGLCMIQIWPIWLKIGVWWCSVTFLVTFGVLCVVRLMLFVLMWIVGFRGIWLFPNLFDDNQTFAGSFMPVFGKGDPVIVETDSDEEWNEKKRKKKKAEDEAAASSPDKKADSSSDKKPKSDPKEKPPEAAFQFGWINVMLIFGIGAIVCAKLGCFDGENVPDFVVANRQDLEYYFKSLAPPPNDTKVEEEPKLGKDGKPIPEHDPFAQPEPDKKERF